MQSGKETIVKVKIFKVAGYSWHFGQKPPSKQVLEDEINQWLAAHPASELWILNSPAVVEVSIPV
jgi:hypothetical protein